MLMLRYPGIERFYCLNIILIGVFQIGDAVYKLVKLSSMIPKKMIFYLYHEKRKKERRAILFVGLR